MTMMVAEIIDEITRIEDLSIRRLFKAPVAGPEPCQAFGRQAEGSIPSRAPLKQNFIWSTSA